MAKEERHRGCGIDDRSAGSILRVASGSCFRGPLRISSRQDRAAARPGDTIIDGGNSFYKDDIRRAKALRLKGLNYIDIGTSGGVWGVDRGFCMMVGGRQAVR